MAFITKHTNRRSYWLLRTLLVVTLVWSVLAFTPTHAQAPKVIPPLTWADAPSAPLHRSEADWLIETGQKTHDELFSEFPALSYDVGDTEYFNTLSSMGQSGETFFLAYRTDHAYFWFKRGARPEQDVLVHVADFFETRIWPLNTSIYGEAPNPAQTGDDRIHIINEPAIGMGIYGAFDPIDQCPRAVCPESNERQIIYISLDAAPLGSDMYLTTVAHEHQHLIQYAIDGNERRWFNEGLSQLAEHLNGFEPGTISGPNVTDFLRNPDHDLRGWSFYDVGAYYGASYLFMVYLYERFGIEFIRTMTASEYDDFASIDATLHAMGFTVTVDEVFADWIIANYLDDPYAGNGQYYYSTLDLPAQITPQRLPFANGMSTYREGVFQFGADYVQIDQPGTYQLSFDGADETAIIGATPQSDDWMWWSYNGESSAARLTGSFDLRSLTTATLSFNAWWEIEPDYDWFQVMVSDNNGADWHILDGDQANGHSSDAPGAHYSSSSSGWINEKIDLSAYVGTEVLVRFEYLTDSSDSLAGVVLDDIGIVELGALDDVEALADYWQVEGFLRIAGTVPQHWTVAIVIEHTDGSADVLPLALDEFNTGYAQITLAAGETATVIIGASAPFTTNRANYKLATQKGA